MFRSLRWRLVASYLLLTLLTVSVTGILALSLLARQIHAEETRYLTSNAEAVARQALPMMAPAARISSLRQLVRTSAFLGSAQVRILDREERVLADSGPRGADDAAAWMAAAGTDEAEGLLVAAVPFAGPGTRGLPEDVRARLARLVPGGEVRLVRRQETAWGQILVFESVPAEQRPAEAAAGPEQPGQTVRVAIGAGAARAGYVEVTAPSSRAGRAMVAARRAFVLAGMGAAGLALLLGFVVSRSVSAPLHELALAAKRMSRGDFTARARKHGDDEIGQVTQQFNQMAGRLEESFAEVAAQRDALRHFIADASHELRTPITALKTFNELLENPDLDGQTRAEFTRESGAQIRRLEWITANLLDLSRLDAGIASLDLVELDARDLAERAAAPARALAAARGVTVHLTLPQAPVPLCSDTAHVEIALGNLLDNAVKFGPAGSSVELGVEPHSEEVVFWVSDEGPGIEPADLPHVFERFYRGTSSAGDAPRGMGLGLAIVKSVAEAHGGRVEVASEPSHGSRFTLVLPASHRPAAPE